MTDRILYTCAEAAALMGLGRSLVFQLVMRGDLPSIKLGRARRIPATALHEYIQRLQSEQNSEEVAGR